MEQVVTLFATDETDRQAAAQFVAELVRQGIVFTAAQSYAEWSPRESRYKDARIVVTVKWY